MPTVPMLVMQNKLTPNSEKTFWMILAQCKELSSKLFFVQNEFHAFDSVGFTTNILSFPLALQVWKNLWKSSDLLL